MTQLANANLLDDTVANSSSLKNQRIYNTAKKAINPRARVEKVEKQNVQSNMNAQKDDYESNEYQDEYDDTDYNDIKDIKNENYRRYEPNYSSKKSVERNKDSKATNNDEKILGMSKPLFYTILGVVAIVGGVYAYNKFFKKKKIKSLGDSMQGGVDAMSNMQPTSMGVPEIKIT